jgi:hypothetical protein
VNVSVQRMMRSICGKKTIENFNELHIIIGHVQPNGNGAETGSKVVADPIQSNEDLMGIPSHVLVYEDIYET